MRIIRMTYPCVKCGKSIDPELAYCPHPHCRYAQENVRKRLHYNVFYRRDDADVLHIMFAGHILRLEDILKHARNAQLKAENRYYVASYRPVYITEISGSSNKQFDLLTFTQFVDGELGPDQGKRNVEVTFKEM